MISLFIISSSCHAISTDILDPLSPPLSIVHRFQQVFRATPHIYTELLCVGLSWLPCLYSAMWRGPQEYITYELVPTSPAMSWMSGSSNFDSFHDGWYVAVSDQNKALSGIRAQRRGINASPSTQLSTWDLRLYLPPASSWHWIQPTTAADPA